MSEMLTPYAVRPDLSLEKAFYEIGRRINIEARVSPRGKSRGEA